MGQPNVTRSRRSGRSHPRFFCGVMPLSRRRVQRSPSPTQDFEAKHSMIGSRTVIIDCGISPHFVGITVSDSPKHGGVIIDHAVCADRKALSRSKVSAWQTCFMTACMCACVHDHVVHTQLRHTPDCALVT